MSSGGGGGEGGEGSSRVSNEIPNGVRKTIQTIREITGKQHSDDDIYAVLKECSMDPNETAQKLLYLDTFHEVKNKRDRRNENLSSKKSEDSRVRPGTRGRLARAVQGNYSSSISSDAGGGRNASARRENGISHIKERGSVPSSFPVAQKTKSNAAPYITKALAAIPNGPTNLSNGSLSHDRASQSSLDGVINVSKGHSIVDANKLEAAPPQPAVVDASTLSGFVIQVVEQGKSTSGSDQLSTSAAPTSVSGVPSVTQHPGAVGKIKRGVRSQRISAEPNNHEGNKHIPSDVSDIELSKNEHSATGTVSSVPKKRASAKPKAVNKNQLSEPSQPASSATDVSLAVRSSNCDSQLMQESVVPKAIISEVAITTVEDISQSLAELNVHNGQHVTFPNHFQVPEALKNGLTFGSFDANFGSSIKSVNGTGGDNISSCAVESSQGIAVESSQGSDETAKEHSSNQIVSANAENFPDHPQPPTQPVLDNVPPSEGNISSSADSKNDQSKQEIVLPPEGTGNPTIQTIQNAPNYNLGLVSTMLGNQLVQFEGPEPQAQETSRFSNFVGGNSPVLSSPSPTPPIQSSVPPQSVPILRQPYPPNFFPYGPYYHQFYLPPIQYLSHNGFPQQPSSGNVYLTPAAAAAAGVKFTLPQLKPGTNTGNPTHIGIPSGGSYINPAVGYGHGPAVTSGNSTGNEDLAASQLKENHIYTTGQLSEGSAVWIPGPGQDISSLQVNSLYNLPPQGQHVAFSPAQAGHGAFAGMYAGHALAAPSTLLQQSQAMAGAVETVGPPSGAYQQPQHAQINWNANF